MVSSELLKEFGYTEEVLEHSVFRKGGWSYKKTGYPKTNRTYRLVYENFNVNVEDSYYWIIDRMRIWLGFPWIDKLTDVFAASEQSSFFGAAQQRLGFQQDKVSQLLATIGKMVKELFQLVRELRIIDERLAYYRDSYSKNRSQESAEITLKGVWIDMVEQGSKNPASVYGMARELQFVTLPDLFFKYHPQTANDIEETVDKLEFNRKVREVLKRKLRSYLEWKKHTFKEMKVKRTFTLKYLRQHYDIIHMYMAWVKPYLRNIQRLQLEDRTGSPDLINAFEGSIIEIEVLAKKFPIVLKVHDHPHRNSMVYAVALANFTYRTRPGMKYQQDGYGNQGPLHAGRLEITLRAYDWTQEEIDRYKAMLEKEDFELLSTIDGSVKAAMEALGEELEKYLEESGESFQYKYKRAQQDPKKTFKQPGMLDPFISIFKGAGELGSSLTGSKGTGKKKADKWQVVLEREEAKKHSVKMVWYSYKDYKKTHKMLTW